MRGEVFAIPRDDAAYEPEPDANPRTPRDLPAMEDEPALDRVRDPVGRVGEERVGERAVLLVEGDTITARGLDLPRLSLPRRIVQEAMRLYPPAWGFSRQALADAVA